MGYEVNVSGRKERRMLNEKKGCKGREHSHKSLVRVGVMPG